MRRVRTVSVIGTALLLTVGCDKKETQPATAETPTTSQPAANPPPVAKPTTVETDKSVPVQTYVDPGADEPTVVRHAIAVLEPTAKSNVTGTVELEQTDRGLHVKAHVTGLPPGKHGFHIHLFGDCSGDDGKTAGTHFNFAGSSEKPPADIARITGNLGELDANDKGVADHDATIENGSLQGRFSVLGRAIIVHEKGNDASKPPIGAAGARLACGVIGIAKSG